MAAEDAIHLETIAEMLRAHERLDDEKWAQNERRWEEANRMHTLRWEEAARVMRSLEERQMAGFTGVNVKIDNLSHTYSNRFWNLAVGIIGILLAALGALILRYFSHV